MIQPVADPSQSIPATEPRSVNDVERRNPTEPRSVNAVEPDYASAANCFSVTRPWYFSWAMTCSVGTMVITSQGQT